MVGPEQDGDGADRRASKKSHIDDAVAALSIELSDEEVDRLKRPYTLRYDFQGIADPAALARITAKAGVKPAGAGSSELDTPSRHRAPYEPATDANFSAITRKAIRDRGDILRE